MEMLSGQESKAFSRKPEIIADAAYYIISQDPTVLTGNFFIDDEILKKAGVTDFDQYLFEPANRDKLMPDLFVNDDPLPPRPADLPSVGDNVRKTEAPQGKVGKLFKAIESNLSPELVAKTQAVFQFNVTGEEAGKWS